MLRANGCNLHANFGRSKSLRKGTVSVNRVYAATQGERLVYTRSHLPEVSRSKSLIRCGIRSNPLWQGNCHTRAEGGAGLKASSMGLRMNRRLLTILLSAFVIAAICAFLV